MAYCVLMKDAHFKVAAFYGCLCLCKKSFFLRHLTLLSWWCLPPGPTWY